MTELATEATAPEGPESTKSRAALANSLREQILKSPRADDLRDYCLIESELERCEQLLPTIPPDVVADSKYLILRMIGRYGENEARSDAIRRRSSRWWRASRWIRGRVPLGALARIVPWSIVLPVFVVWVTTRTLHHSNVGITHATWEAPPAQLDIAHNEPANIRIAMGRFWSSRFATDVLKDLPAMCAAELTTSSVSIPCIQDLLARLQKIALSENQEIDTVDLVTKEVREWCPDEGQPPSARLLYEPDFVTDLLWPYPAYAIGEKKPLSCKDAEFDYRRTLAKTRLMQYRALVAAVRDKANFLDLLLRYHLPRPGAFQRGAVSLAIQNTGDAEATIDLRALGFSMNSQWCRRVAPVVLDRYTRRPTKEDPPLRSVLSPGAAMHIELEVDCSNVVNPQKSWSFFYGDDALNGSFEAE